MGCLYLSVKPVYLSSFTSSMGKYFVCFSFSPEVKSVCHPSNTSTLPVSWSVSRPTTEYIRCSVRCQALNNGGISMTCMILPFHFFPITRKCFSPRLRGFQQRQQINDRLLSLQCVSFPVLFCSSSMRKRLFPCLFRAKPTSAQGRPSLRSQDSAVQQEKQPVPAYPAQCVCHIPAGAPRACFHNAADSLPSAS